MPFDPASFFDRLRRRKIAQWTIGYLSAAWLTLQVVNVIGDQFAWPGALVRGITLALGAGLLATLTIAWFHGEKGHQRVTRIELLLLTAILVSGGFAIRAAAGRVEPRERVDTAARVRDPAAIAVVPFGPTSPDSILDRLGRDLAVTLGATLAGIETLRVVDPLTVLAQTSRNGPASLERALLMADRLGAGRLLHGSLARSGDRVRLDATLYAVNGARAVARVTVEQDPQRVSAITDSVVFSLVRQLWSGSTPEIPSPAALATSSVEALRAYLDGEHALAFAEMPRALASFERAYALDSTYWFAYWRSLYPRVYEGTRADSATIARIVEHRAQLPPPDRLLVEVMNQSARHQLARLEDGARRFATHWPTWYTYANLLVHWAPYLGTSYDAARAALERVVELNPHFGPAWEHLHWIAVHQRDTAAIAATLGRMEAFAVPGGYRFNDELLTLYRTTSHIAAHGGRFTDSELESTADYIANYRGPIPQAAFGTGLLIYGMPRAQMQLGEAVLARNPGGEMATGMWHGQALSLAGRGDWDAAADAADQWSRMSGAPGAALGRYGLLAAGAALGAVPPADAAARRPAPGASYAQAWQLAELAWLDGVTAYAGGDAAGIEAARRMLRSSGAPYIPLLDGSLAALAAALAGHREQAARAIVALEDDAADRFLQSGYRSVHPYLSSINRVLAARWLIEAGDHAQAARLLTFMEAVLPGVPPLEAVNRTVGALGLYDRARAVEAMGRLTEARTHYTSFIDQFDRPTAALAPIVNDARVRLAGLSREPR
jgi:TolB-like protein